MKESYQQLETRTIELTKFRSNTNEGNSLSINEELTSNEKNINQDIHPRPRSSSWSSSFSYSRSISLSILQPLSPKRSRYNHVDQNSIEVQQATFETKKIFTNTTNYIRDNNIGKKTDIVPSKQIIAAQNLVHIRKYDYSKTKRIPVPTRETVKRNYHSQPTTETNKGRSSQRITNISITSVLLQLGKKKNEQITEGKTNSKKHSDLSTNTLHRVTRRNTTTKNEPTDDSI